MKKAIFILLAVIFFVQNTKFVSLLIHLGDEYALVDDFVVEKMKNNKDGKAENDTLFSAFYLQMNNAIASSLIFINLSVSIPPKPYLQRLSPPPNIC